MGKRKWVIAVKCLLKVQESQYEHLNSNLNHKSSSLKPTMHSIDFPSKQYKNPKINYFAKDQVHCGPKIHKTQKTIL